MTSIRSLRTRWICWRVRRAMQKSIPELKELRRRVDKAVLLKKGSARLQKAKQDIVHAALRGRI